VCPNSLSFHCFHLGLIVESIKELGGVSNKLKSSSTPFQDTTICRGLESTVEKGRDIINTKIRFHIATLGNTQNTSPKKSFLIHKTKIQESQLRIKNQNLTVGIGMDTLA
jgi:hypothetical protein